MASFQTLKNGHVQARVRRKGKHESQTFLTLADAKAWAKKEEKRIDSAIAGRSDINAQTYTVGDAVAFYFEEHIQHKKSATEYKYIFSNLPNYIVRERLAVATRDTAKRWIAEMVKTKLNPATVARRVGAVRAGINYATQQKAALHNMPNPYKGLKLPALPRSANRTRTATDEELNEFYKRIGKRSKHLMDYIVLALETATRRGELITLKWEDVDFKKSIAHLHDTKNGEARDVPLSELALQVLKARREKQKRAVYVFTSQAQSAEGGHIQPAAISRAFRRVRDEIEKEKGERLNLRLHDLRHTSATRWHQDGFKNPIDLMSITGHKDIRSLARYVNNKAEEIAQQMRDQRKAKSATATPERRTINND